MNERCDGCGKQVPVMVIAFTGRQFLCPDCLQHKAPTAMGACGKR